MVYFDRFAQKCHLKVSFALKSPWRGTFDECFGAEAKSDVNKAGRRRKRVAAIGE